jgi:hypothetical protein
LYVTETGGTALREDFEAEKSRYNRSILPVKGKMPQSAGGIAQFGRSRQWSRVFPVARDRGWLAWNSQYCDECHSRFIDVNSLLPGWKTR